MRTLSVVICIVLLTTAAMAQYTQDTPNISLDLKGVSIKEALNTLFQNVSDEYVASQDITDQLGTVTLKLDNASFSTALEKLAEAAEPRIAVYKANRYAGRSIGMLYLIGLADSAATRRSGINLKLDNVSIAEAMQLLFQGSGYAYFATGDLYGKVSLNVKNASFVQALDALTRPNDVKYLKAGEAGYIVEPPPGMSRYARTPQETHPYWVTKSLAPTTVKNALEQIEPGWSFADNLGQTKTPAVSFHNVPRPHAVAFVLYAAGLVPPVDGGKVVKSKGKVSLEKAFRYVTPPGSPYSGKVSIAARGTQGPGGRWLFTLLTDKAEGVNSLDPLFGLAGQSYVIGSRKSDQVLSAQLYDMSLDGLLDNVLPVLGMQYKKTGLAGKQTYLVSPKK